MGAQNTSLTTLSIIALLTVLSGSVVAAISGIPVLGAYAGLLFGVVLAAAGIKTFDFDISEVEDVGGTLISIGAGLTGLNLALMAFNLNLLGMIPSWIGLGTAGLGLVLVNWHWAERLV